MRKHSSISEQISCQVAFHDVDLAQVVWHGHYLRYLENARWALMRTLDFDLATMMASGYLWPIVDLRVKYVRTANFEDRLNVRASLVEWQQRMVINYLITDERDGARVARAQTTQVAVRAESKELQLTLPAAFIERVDSVLLRQAQHPGAGS
jgi:acyl-CoA thioester hydrolase